MKVQYASSLTGHYYAVEDLVFGFERLPFYLKNIYPARDRIFVVRTDPLTMTLPWPLPARSGNCRTAGRGRGWVVLLNYYI